MNPKIEEMNLSQLNREIDRLITRRDLIQSQLDSIPKEIEWPGRGTLQIRSDKGGVNYWYLKNGKWTFKVFIHDDHEEGFAMAFFKAEMIMYSAHQGQLPFVEAPYHSGNVKVHYQSTVTNTIDRAIDIVEKAFSNDFEKLSSFMLELQSGYSK